MLTRVYIDNFLCFVNFEYRPDRKQLIFGGNGSGKTSFLRALLAVRQFAGTGLKLEEVLPARTRTRWLEKAEQKFDIEARLDGHEFIYRLEVGLAGDPPLSVVLLETVHCDGKPIFEFVKGEVRLYNDRFQNEVSYPFDSTRSAFETIGPRKDNQLLIRFKQWLVGLYCFRLEPGGTYAGAEREDLYPQVGLNNFASWYRHLVQSDPKQTALITASLRASIEGFNFLQLENAGENRRLLFADFDGGGGKSFRFALHELSDGQRCLVSLYAILHFLLAKGSTVIIDEPDNFISLREIQPWLMAVTDTVEEGHGQIIVISHHPEILNQWAPGNGVQFVRDGAGPARIEALQGDPESSLTPSELVARGWERGSAFPGDRPRGRREASEPDSPLSVSRRV